METETEYKNPKSLNHIDLLTANIFAQWDEHRPCKWDSEDSSPQIIASSNQTTVCFKSICRPHFCNIL